MESENFGMGFRTDIARVYTIHEYIHKKQVFQYIQVYTQTKISRGDDFHVFILTILIKGCGHVAVKWYSALLNTVFLVFLRLADDGNVNNSGDEDISISIFKI